MLTVRPIILIRTITGITVYVVNACSIILTRITVTLVGICKYIKLFKIRSSEVFMEKKTTLKLMLVKTK